ncbi:hypothetical protein [Dyadobacter sp. 3J3]|uniref:hypothetical protein n=1 Tax=Dyadobacter sp. 3J3 TaxID=2606600 RepID=UPI00135A213E|nr:hypothetical protein [Dyadobacter sp. 3J3]
MTKEEIIERINAIDKEIVLLRSERSIAREQHLGTVQRNSVLDEIEDISKRNTGAISLLSLERRELEEELKKLLAKEE